MRSVVLSFFLFFHPPVGLGLVLVGWITFLPEGGGTIYLFVSVGSGRELVDVPD